MKNSERCHAILLIATALWFDATPAQAFIHDSHESHQKHHSKGCFVTTSAVHHTKGIRHWRNPCPHQERKHLNHHHSGYHRLPPGH